MNALRVLPALLVITAGAGSARAEGPDCVPPCRTGFVCVSGQCVSACNPPCPSGQSCVNSDCVPAAAPAPEPVPVATAVPVAPAPAAAPVVAPAPAQPAPAPAPVPMYAAPPGPMPDAAAPPPGPRRGAHVHDGFYFRAGIGAGGGSFAGNLESSDATFDGAGVDGKGLTIPVELSFGGTVAPGLVIGGGSFGAVIPAPENRAKNYGVTLEAKGGPVLVSTLGPFMDYYFDPLQGLHLQAGIALAVVTASEGDDPGAASQLPSQDYSGIGWSAMLGFGWEAWTGDQASFGVLGRAQYGGASLDATSGTGSIDANFFLPTVLATFTYH